jgi:hypothetical protein
MFISTRVRNAGAAAAAIVLAAAAPAAAQSEAALKSFFEGQRVTLRIDMPGTSDGVDVHADSSRAVDFAEYRDHLKKYGAAIRAGDTITVTLVKVKKDLIEFQLGGGGYGTFGDDTSTSVYIPHVEKSEREKTLEKRVKEETDRDTRRDLERDLDALRERRERENRRIDIERERAEDVKKERIAQKRLEGGTRFNIRYEDRVPPGMRPDDVMAALAEYVDFTRQGFRAEPPASAEAPTPSGDITMLRKGMTRGDAERAFGRAVEASQRTAGEVSITTLVFVVADQRVNADFVEDVLVRYTITSK